MIPVSAPRSLMPPGVDRAGRTRRKRLRERGVALVMVLGALTMLTVLLADFQDETSAGLGSALSARDAIRAEYAARSGVNLARLLIATEPTIRKALGPIGAMLGVGQIPVWEFADQVLGAFNDQGGSERFAALAGVPLDEGKNLGLPGAGFDIVIVDEDSKINVNQASREAFSQGLVAAELIGLIGSPQFDPLFTGRDGDGQYSDRQTVCGAIIDWVDSKQEASACDPGSGAAANATPEDSFYQLLDPPYMRKNAPLDSLEELHRVRGVSDDFWATFIEPEHDDPRQRNVTIWGKGKVNVNTANAQTLFAVICQPPATGIKMCHDPLEAAKFLQLVTMVRAVASGAPIFGNPKIFINTLKQEGPIGLLLKPFMEPIVLPPSAAKALTAESKAFSFYVTGYVKSGQRETRTKIHAVVDFDGAPPPIDIAALVALDQSGALQRLAEAQEAATKAGAPGSVPAAPPIDPNGYPALLGNSPGGKIVYFRID